MSVERARHVGPARIDITYERFGDPEAPPVMLIMGAGTQMIGWPDAFCRAIADHELQVIRFDNRDAGLSSHFRDGPAPNLLAALAGDLSSASYTLSDMAADTVGLIDGLGFESAHIVGASMGGMIGQTVAFEHPAKIRSLVSMMSTTGDTSVGQPHPEAFKAFGGPQPLTREDFVNRTLAVSRVLASPAFPFDEDAVRERVERAYDRSHDPLAIARQAVAVVASGDRTARLRSIQAPTLVIHGVEDRMCDVSGGRATARAIHGAELVEIDGMGHDLPRQLWPKLTGLITGFVKRAEGLPAGQANR